MESLAAAGVGSSLCLLPKGCSRLPVLLKKLHRIRFLTDSQIGGITRCVSWSASTTPKGLPRGLAQCENRSSPEFIALAARHRKAGLRCNPLPKAYPSQCRRPPALSSFPAPMRTGLTRPLRSPRSCWCWQAFGFFENRACLPRKRQEGYAVRIARNTATRCHPTVAKMTTRKTGAGIAGILFDPSRIPARMNH